MNIAAGNWETVMKEPTFGAGEATRRLRGLATLLDLLEESQHSCPGAYNSLCLQLLRGRGPV